MNISCSAFLSAWWSLCSTFHDPSLAVLVRGSWFMVHSSCRMAHDPSRTAQGSWINGPWFMAQDTKWTPKYSQHCPKIFPQWSRDCFTVVQNCSPKCPNISQIGPSVAPKLFRSCSARPHIFLPELTKQGSTNVVQMSQHCVPQMFQNRSDLFSESGHKIIT